MREALQEAGELLAEAMRAGLREKGLSDVLRVKVESGRVRVVSGNADVREAEIGCKDAPPTAPLEAAARAASPDAVHVLQRRLQEALR